jgi:hypothetical protein
MIRCGQKAHLGGDPAEDEVWMFGIRGQELTRCFNGCVSRLHGDVRRRQIAAHQHVEMGNLAEWLVHISLRSQSYPRQLANTTPQVHFRWCQEVPLGDTDVAGVRARKTSSQLGASL